MFTLRIIYEKRSDAKLPFEQVVENHKLGNSYVIFKKGVTSFFKTEMENRYPETSHDDVRALLLTDNGNENGFLLFNNKENVQFSYFIMAENGKTFEKL